MVQFAADPRVFLARRPVLLKFCRYAGVSVISTLVSLLVLTALVGTGAATAGWANVIATAVGTVPSFELNRRWVWGKGGRRSMAAEVAPFAVMSFVSLAVSTLAVSRATAWAGGAGFGDHGRAAIAVATNLASFGSMWIVQYVMLDRILFRAGR
ncbi:MAG TPA: GtrA family protein [Acidimicrobiales bacterium]|nr:GtrA family protein [Acidimicrobiales bacterium]